MGLFIAIAIEMTWENEA